MLAEAIHRSAAKTISWKLINIVADFTLLYFLTGKIVLAASFTSISFITTLTLYFVHERVWNRVTWGKV